MRKLTANFSAESLKNLADNIRAYTDSLSKKQEIFVERLASIGIPVIQQRIAAVNSDSDVNRQSDAYVEIMYRDKEAFGAKLVVHAEDILFIEFGAGIHYNKTEHPQADELGYGVGTYPGQTHAFNEKGWWYTDDMGNPHHSYGTKATMPLYSAYAEMIARVDQIAREVFGNG